MHTHIHTHHTPIWLICTHTQSLTCTCRHTHTHTTHLSGSLANSVSIFVQISRFCRGLPFVFRHPRCLYTASWLKTEAYQRGNEKCMVYRYESHSCLWLSTYRYFTRGYHCDVVASSQLDSSEYRAGMCPIIGLLPKNRHTTYVPGVTWTKVQTKTRKGIPFTISPTTPIGKYFFELLSLIFCIHLWASKFKCQIQMQNTNTKSKRKNKSEAKTEIQCQ